MSEEFIETHVCNFCLALSVQDMPPDRCEGCEMAACSNCGTWLKERNCIVAKFCYGCGEIAPETRSRFSRASGIACNFMYDAWKKRNTGRDCEIHAISTGWKSVEDKKNGVPRSSWIIKGDSREDVRKLTQAEEDLINEKPI